MSATFKVARIGDLCTHGAVIITGDSSHLVNGRPVARRGDLVSCPIHGINPIIAVVANPLLISSGQPVARIGSITECGAVVITGSGDTKADR